MKLISTRWLFAALLGLAVSTQAAATLKVGDPAPKLQVGKWVQGEPVAGFEKDKAYIVEFWATWCGPCRESIPELNKIANKYKDKGLVVIGQDVWENSEAAVAPFVKEMGAKMTYRVALDDKKKEPNGAMAATWMEAAGQDGIPTAFLVAKTGEIAWIGHPMSLKESVIEEVLAGKFDAKKAAADYAVGQERKEKTGALMKDFQRAASAKEWDKANGFLDEVAKVIDPEQLSAVEMMRLQVSLRKGDAAGTEAIAKRLAEKESDEASYYNEIAWLLATQKEPSKGLLDVAEKAAKRANDLSKGQEPEVLDTLARVQFVKGDKEAAIQTQQKAFDLAEGKGKAAYEKTLNSYKAGKIPGGP